MYLLSCFLFYCNPYVFCKMAGDWLKCHETLCKGLFDVDILQDFATSYQSTQSTPGLYACFKHAPSVRPSRHNLTVFKTCTLSPSPAGQLKRSRRAFLSTPSEIESLVQASRDFVESLFNCCMLS
jgi:hypothetical protein